MITYSSVRELPQKELERLFLSVNWESGKLPELLAKAMPGYKTVFTAWDGERLVGLVSAMDDEVMTAYVHFLLVDPEYQKKGIGKRLMEMILEHYKSYNRICLIAENHALDFYKGLGFREYKAATPVYLMN